MRLKKITAITLTALTFLSLTGCGEIEPDKVEDGKYSTQTGMSSLEYSIYINKQITVFTNQLTTRMTMIKNSKDSQYEAEIDMAKRSENTMQKALDEVKVTLPAKGRDEDRESLITAMEIAIKHMQDYQSDLKAGKDTSGYSKNFGNDFNELTGLADLYYQ